MKPLILLHGALNTSTQMQPLQQKLDADFDVQVLTFSGHSAEPHDGIFSMDVFVDDILKFIDDLEIDSCDFFGYSMGGYAATKFAMIHPERVGKIMTLGTNWDWNPESAAKEVAMLDPKVIMEKVPQYASKLQLMFGDQNWISVVEKTATMMLELGNGNGLSQSDFEQIKSTIQICRGSEDKMVSADASIEVVDWLVHGSYKEMPGIPHPLEKVDLGVLAKEFYEFF
ncbi:MAG: alpha/beta hydrolase [Saprospiraceae bacterium]